jgi:hypothetical protein
VPHDAFTLGMEQKLSDFSAEKRNGNMETKMKFCGIETETKFLRRKRKQNNVSGGTDAETEFLFPIKVEFLFYGCSVWPI